MSATGLPPHLVELLVPRKPIEYLTQAKKRQPIQMGGVADALKFFSTEPPPPRIPFEDFKKRRARRAREKTLKHQEELRAARQNYKPRENSNAIGDPTKTIFVGRLSYETTENKLAREMEQFGPISNVKIVRDLSGNSRGYGFIEFQHIEDVHRVLTTMRTIKIDGRIILVDKECGRNQDGWLPRRLGGGRGPPRLGRKIDKSSTVRQVANIFGGATSSRGRDERRSGIRGNREGRGGSSGGGFSRGPGGFERRDNQGRDNFRGPRDGGGFRERDRERDYR
eukprot:GDKJ01019003.1.p1 GENE.GDKJ01019003.1~~GDKJ01019003.1.p1  ORF type:complete len:281 (-),score=43.10 GDKJ01019003.1:57-899(-)